MAKNKSNTEPFKATPEDVERLKINWAENPTFNLEETEGYEEFFDELKTFREQKEAEWAQQHEKDTEEALLEAIEAAKQRYAEAPLTFEIENIVGFEKYHDELLKWRTDFDKEYEKNQEFNKFATMANMSSAFMNITDFFASQAMRSYIPQVGGRIEHHEIIAKNSYDLALTMVKERAKRFELPKPTQGAKVMDLNPGK